MNVHSWSHRTLVAIALITTASCTGMLEMNVAGPDGTERPGAPMNTGEPTNCPPLPGTNSETDRVRLGLERTCKGCHLTGNSGYFASLIAFESLLVRNPRLVRAGNPEESELVMLLEGRRSGDSMTQMPLGGDPFAILSDRGETDISIEEVRNWISTLEVPSISTRPSESVSTVQRTGATHIELGLRNLLGLSLEDFFLLPNQEGITTILPRDLDMYMLHSPDRLPREFWQFTVTPNVVRFIQLGGNTGIFQQSEQRSVSTPFLQNIVPLSQAWCELAVDKPGNTALFTTADPTAGTDDMGALREQIRDWHMLFLAEIASEEDIDFVVDRVFAQHEAASNPRKAWIGTCSYFIRHPLFVFY
jgi:hypothetical protein